uniref:(northern house mosquito) hypothetical protein n=1 Tax=Culex pipiens TaxID=7175 RepID=A0A8D8K308_CULPI
MRLRPRRVAARSQRPQSRPLADSLLETSRQRRRQTRPRHRLQQQPNNLASGLARQVLRPERVSSLPTWLNPLRTASRTKRPPPMTTRTNRPRWNSRRSRKKTASFPSGANFVKADGNYSDRGIGKLYIKVNRKVQIMVLADSSIGQILLGPWKIV